MRISPGVTHQSELFDIAVYKVDDEQQWRIPLLQSLLMIRDDQWEIRFNDGDDQISVEDDDIEEMIHDVCTN